MLRAMENVNYSNENMNSESEYSRATSSLFTCFERIRGRVLFSGENGSTVRVRIENALMYLVTNDTYKGWIFCSVSVYIGQPTHMNTLH